jgi:very-short-patch-repair endonuclease
VNNFRKKTEKIKRWFFPSPAEKEFMRVMGFWFFFIYTVHREYKIKGYYADFCIPSRKVVIEIDGKNYHGGTYDKVRDWVFEKAGWNVIRIPAQKLWREPRQVKKEVRLFTRNPRKWQKLYG